MFTLTPTSDPHAVSGLFDANSLLQDISTLPIQRLRLTLQAIDAIEFRQWPSIAWRAALSQALNANRQEHPQQCPACTPQQPCTYHLLFNPKRPASYVRQRPSRQVPFAYIIQPEPKQQAIAPECSTALELVLIGQKAISHSKVLLEAVHQVGEQGIGMQRGQFRCVESQLLAAPSLLDESGQCLSNAGTLRLTLNTPLQLRTASSLIDPSRFVLSFFLQQVLKRLSSLTYFYGDTQQKLPLHLLEPFVDQLMPLSHCLRWSDDIEHYPPRANESHHAGLLGHIDLSAAAIRPLLPALRFAEQLNVGEGAHLGLGQFKLSTLRH